FTDKFDTFLNLVLGYNALAGGLDLIGPFLGSGPGGGRGGRTGKGGGGRYGLGGPDGGNAGGFRKRGSTWQGLTYRQILREKGIEPGSISQSENAIMKRYFQRYGRDAFVQRFGQEGLERL
ncbi:MAG: hypothetical protein ACKO96_16625, partial [Flammeovirgaceae bacterium]